MLDTDGLEYFIFAPTLSDALTILHKNLIETGNHDIDVANEMTEYAKHHFSVFEGSATCLWKSIDTPEEGPATIGSDEWKKLTGRDDAMHWD